ncbi:MAG: nicotinate-nucleotide--dimethylbenzimidazole phosphoribosyltransferase [Acidimicrobiia bacterium]
MELEQPVAERVGDIASPDEWVAAEAKERHDALVKPRGSLGGLEDLGCQLAAIARTCPPPVPQQAAVVVCAGDHGVLAQGVSPWPQEMTAAMVRTFCGGKAAINALADTIGARVSVLDVGIAAELPAHPRLRSAKVRPGTRDLSREPALTREEAARAILAGAGVVDELRRAGVDLVIGGDMGIGNTTPSACLIGSFTGLPASEITGRGTGIDDATYEHKIAVVQAALDLHRPDRRDPLGVLALVGGLEHAALCGLFLGAAARRLPVILDGVAANAAALAAVAFAPDVRGYLIAGHRSVEPGASAALASLGLEPLLDLDLRLGEGTGALLALPLVQAAAAVLRDMATFADLPVSEPAAAKA